VGGKTSVNGSFGERFTATRERGTGGREGGRVGGPVGRKRGKEKEVEDWGI